MQATCTCKSLPQQCYSSWTLVLIRIAKQPLAFFGVSFCCIAPAVNQRLNQYNDPIKRTREALSCILLSFHLSGSSLQFFLEYVPVVGLHFPPHPGFFGCEATSSTPAVGAIVCTYINTRAFFTFAHCASKSPFGLTRSKASSIECSSFRSRDNSSNIRWSRFLDLIGKVRMQIV